MGEAEGLLVSIRSGGVPAHTDAVSRIFLAKNSNLLRQINPCRMVILLLLLLGYRSPIRHENSWALFHH